MNDRDQEQEVEILREVPWIMLNTSFDVEAWIDNMNRDLQRMQRELREDLNLRKNEELAAVLERANKVIQGIAESEKFDLILQEAVYISPRIDITDRVIKALADKADK